MHKIQRLTPVKVDVPPLMEYLRKQLLDSFNSKIDTAIKDKCEQLGYYFDRNRLHCVPVDKVGDLWYYLLDNGCLSPLIAFSEMEITHTDDGIGSIKMTHSCKELPMEVFKPIKHEKDSYSL